MAKPSPKAPHSLEDLASRVVAAATARLRKTAAPGRRLLLTGRQNSYVPDGRLVAIGSSTGGVEALIEILSQFPANCPPTIITQHMPALFTKSLAQRLDRLCPPSVAEATDGAVLEPGRVYLAPGGIAHLEITKGPPWRCRLRSAAPVSGHRPSVDAMFYSVANIARSNAVGVILTGMGRDGAEGLLAMRNSRALTIGQDLSSSVIYGMPKAAFELGAVARQLPLSAIAVEILSETDATSERRRH